MIQAIRHWSWKSHRSRVDMTLAQVTSYLSHVKWYGTRKPLYGRTIRRVLMEKIETQHNKKSLSEVIFIV